MCLSSDILPESRQKCQINGHSTWIRVSRDWFTPMQVECRYPLASGASLPDEVCVKCAHIYIMSSTSDILLMTLILDIKEILTGLEVNMQFCCPEEWEYSTRRSRVEYSHY